MAMAAVPTEDGAPGAQQARPQRPGAGSREREFASARSHSRRVRWLKVTLPVAAALMALGFFGYSYVSSPLPLDIDISGAAVSDGKLVMTEPKLDGFTKDNLPYSMRAARALQNLDSTGLIELQEMKARLPVDDTNFATVDAPRGVYDRDKNTLEIPGTITVTTTDGMEASLKSAFIDLGKGDFHTLDPVEIALNGTRIAADSMTVLENGKVLVFEKRVKLELSPGKIKAGQQAEGEANAGN